MRGAECWTDHRLVRSILSLQIAPPHRKTSKLIRLVFNVTKMESVQCLGEFVTTWTAAQQHMDPTQLTNHRIGINSDSWVTDCTKAIIGKKCVFTKTGSTIMTRPYPHSSLNIKKTSQSGRITHALTRNVTGSSAFNVRPVLHQARCRMIYRKNANADNSKTVFNTIKAVYYGPAKPHSCLMIASPF